MFKRIKHLPVAFAVAIVAVNTAGFAALPADDFNDNSTSSEWLLVQTDTSILLANETNQRLEFTANENTDSGGYVLAGYQSNGWTLDLTSDFAMRVDFNYQGGYSDGDAGVAMAITFGSLGDFVDISAGRDDVVYYAYSIFENGLMIGENWWSRTGFDSGTLYMSYDANQDELYFSSTGYWSDNAIFALSGYVAGQVGASEALVLLGGFSLAPAPAFSGSEAYLDNFVVDVPEPATLSLLTIGGLALIRRRRR